MNGSHLFIADLHLNPETDSGQESGHDSDQNSDYNSGQVSIEDLGKDSGPTSGSRNAPHRTTALALRFLHQAQGRQHLYILGDLFEYWLGDDAGLPLYAPVLKALRAVSDSGCAITIMLGNRDFLLGEAFAEAAGATLVADDEFVIELGGTRVLLMHGDTLCTDDTDYQRFRRNLREPRWQQQFLAKSIDERRDHAEAMRAASHDASTSKPATIMDVNEASVAARLQATGCQTLIHGHTHRPAVHEGPGTGQQRLVVGDWHPQQARFAEWDGTQLQLSTFS